MKKSKIAILVAILVMISGVQFEKINVSAANRENQAKGIYLAEGNSSISKVSTYKINATGVTSAALKCNVSVLVTVEQFRNDTWYYYTSWQTSNANAFTASISKTLNVDLGYFYRVVSTHTAGTDTSSSATNAIWMGL